MLTYISLKSDIIDTEKSFKKLEDLEISALSGYALQYYLLAKIQVGELSQIDDFCNRIKSLKPRMYFRQDIEYLVKRLTKTTTAGGNEIALRSLANHYWSVKRGRIIDSYLINNCKDGLLRLNEVVSNIAQVEYIDEYRLLRNKLSQCGQIR